jgi:hypothetical protein
MITENDIEKAREICRKIVKSTEFLEWALQYKFTYLKEPLDLTNIRLHQFGTPVFFYNQPKRWLRPLIIGFSDSKGIHVNTAAVKTVEELAGNIAHESMHVLGYGHPYFNTKQRPFSVPYAIGYFFKQEAAKYVQ